MLLDQDLWAAFDLRGSPFCREAHLRKAHTCSEDVWQGRATVWPWREVWHAHVAWTLWRYGSRDRSRAGINLQEFGSMGGSMGQSTWLKMVQIQYPLNILNIILNSWYHLVPWYPWDLNPRKLDCLCGTERRNDEQLPRVHFAAPDHAKKSRMPSGLHLDAGLFCWLKVSFRPCFWMKEEKKESNFGLCFECVFAIKVGRTW